MRPVAKQFLYGRPYKVTPFPFLQEYVVIEYKFWHSSS